MLFCGIGFAEFIALREFMKFNIEIKNSSIHFSNQEINLNQKGIYLIVGSNGVGKTTILKNIVFTPRFQEKNCVWFSYAEQNPVDYNVKIRDYLLRYNDNVDQVLLQSLLSRLELTHLDLNRKLFDVSGGELVKLNLIASLIKDTPFVFWDEPTNNLDDESVFVLKALLQEMSLSRIFVIVSHDPRLELVEHHTILVEKDSITLSYSNQTQASTVESLQPCNCKYPGRRLVFRHLLRPATLLSWLLLLLYATIFVFFNHVVFLERYDRDEPAQDDNSILVYTAEEEYGELNQKYAKCQGISVEESRYYSLIRYSDIPELVQKYHLRDVFIENCQFSEKFLDLLHESEQSNNPELLRSDPPLLSIPQVVRENYYGQTAPLLSTDYLLEGRYPEDEQREIVMSRELLKRYYPGAEIGDQVELQGISYTLVGIHILDAYIVSYDGSNGFVYRYSPDTYEAFVQEQTAYKSIGDRPVSFIHMPEFLVMLTPEGEEKTVLHQVFIDYPADNYRSHSYDVDMAEDTNQTLIRNALLINIAVSAFVGLFIALVGVKRRKLYQTEAESFDNYYLSKPLTVRLFGLAESIACLILLVVCLLIIWHISEIRAAAVIESIAVAVVFVISVLPSFMIFIKKND